MLGYVTMGTDDIDRARDFYAALLGTIGASELMRMSDEDKLYALRDELGAAGDRGDAAL